jgi:pyrimidine deaminase RibD-like protein
VLSGTAVPSPYCAVAVAAAPAAAAGAAAGAPASAPAPAAPAAPAGSGPEGRAAEDRRFLLAACAEAARCAPAPGAYSVGAVLVARGPAGAPPRVLATGFSRELPGNTHAEEVCLLKLGLGGAGVSAGAGGAPLPLPLPPRGELTLYCTMEPCSRRLSGKLGCAQRLLGQGDADVDASGAGAAGAGAGAAGAGAGAGAGAEAEAAPAALVSRVVMCLSEPANFVADCRGAALLRAAGVEVEVIEDAELLRLARAPNAHLLGEGGAAPAAAASAVA